MAHFFSKGVGPTLRHLVGFTSAEVHPKAPDIEHGASEYATLLGHKCSPRAVGGDSKTFFLVLPGTVPQRAGLDAAGRETLIPDAELRQQINAEPRVQELFAALLQNRRICKPTADFVPRLKGGQYIRDIPLAFTDGVVSTLLVALGMIARGITGPEIIWCSAAATSAAGPIAMGMGEIIATRTQNREDESKQEWDDTCFKTLPQQELARFILQLHAKGIKGKVIHNLMQVLVDLEDESPEDAATMARVLRSGTADAEYERSPVISAAVSAGSFLAGSLATTLPALISVEFGSKTAWIATAFSCGLSVIALGTVGGVLARNTRYGATRGALEAIGLSALGGLLCYGISFVTSEALV